MGFFDHLPIVKHVPSLPRCGACKLSKQCHSPKLTPYGAGNSQILFVVEYPTKDDDARGKWLSGESGKLFRSACSAAGLTQDDYQVTGALICHPQGKTTNEHIGHCLPTVLKTINDLDPIVIVPMGNGAIESVVSHYWGQSAVANDGSSSSYSHWHGQEIPLHKPNCWVLPTWSPSYLLRDTSARDGYLQPAFRKHIKRAAELSESRPWEGDPPNYKSQVEIIHSDKKAAKIIRKMIATGGLTAFDFEGDRLKPDSPGTTITSCSICWRGKRTIAYPWYGEAVTATIEYLKSDLPKIASNLKFEERWCMSLLKLRVKNWAWDTALAAHMIDNRKGVTSIKFQSFSKLGFPIYDKGIRGYLEGKGGNGKNTIDRANLDALLIYNGLDSLLEYEVAIKQMKELNYVL